MNDNEAFMQWLLQSNELNRMVPAFQQPVPGFSVTPSTSSASEHSASSPPLAKAKAKAVKKDLPERETKQEQEDYLEKSSEDNITHDQWIKMTSKERRQLRNKISARNFRNRRKEYVSALETQVERYKNENSQLRLELKWVRSTIDKLQKENDQLRVEVIFHRNSNKPSAVQAYGQPSYSPPLAPHSSAPLLPVSGDTSSRSSSGSYSTTFIPQYQGQPYWDGTVPLPGNNYMGSMGISEMSMAVVLPNDKTEISTPSLDQYSLLGPALMSIVLNHAISMNTDQILSQTRVSRSLSPSMPLDDNILLSPKLCIGIGMGSLFPDDSKKGIWTLPLHLLPGTAESEEKEVIVWYEAPVTGFRAHCPLYWIQRQFCRFIITYVVVRYPQFEDPCRQYLPICERFRRRQIVAA